MKRLAWFSGVLAAFLATSAGFAQVGAPVAGASGPPSGAYTSAQQVTAAQSLHSAYVLCKSFTAVAVPADTTEDVLATCSVPANAMGASGLLRITTYWSFTNNADTKTMRVRFNGAAGTSYFQVNGTTQQFYVVTTIIGNRGATNSQGGMSMFTNASASASLQSTAALTSAADTTGTTSIVASGQKQVSGDTFTLEGITVELLSDGT